MAQALERLADPLADDRVLVHHHPLLVGEPARLVEDLVGDADLADVVQHAALAERLLGVLVEPAQPAHLDAEGAHALALRARGAASTTGQPSSKALATTPRNSASPASSSLAWGSAIPKA